MRNLLRVAILFIIIAIMRYAVIDIGSNSVRLLISEELQRVYKKINTTGLGKGLAATGKLQLDSMMTSADAVEDFYREANREGCREIYVFATEAVRSADNREEFLNMLKIRGINVDVVPSEEEAKLGFAGAYTDGVCCVVDIGGASTELAVGDAKGLDYAKSLPIGLVRIHDACGEDLKKIDEYIGDVIKGYGKLTQFDTLLSIGGTASTFVAIKEDMKVYQPKLVDNYKLSLSDVEQITKMIYDTNMPDRLNINGLEPKRRHLIVGGGRLLSALMRMLNRDFTVVRESDNQEGYLKYKKGLIKL